MEISESTADNSVSTIGGWLFKLLFIVANLAGLAITVYTFWEYGWSGAWMFISMIVFFMLASTAWTLGNWFREFVQPDMYFTSGVKDAFNKKIYWLVGPQWASFSMAFLIIFAVPLVTIDSNSKKNAALQVQEIAAKEQVQRDAERKAEAVQKDDADAAEAALFKKDYVTALNKFKSAALKNDAYGQFQVGNMYFNGQGVVQDYAEALRWYKLAAAQGYVGAQHNLGNMYYKGLGVVQEYAEAARWFKLAAAQGYVGAQYNLGIGYNAGQGVVQDNSEAVRWFKLAAAQGHAGAQYNLGISYDKGQGVVQNYAEAVSWYKLAAAQGHAGAQLHLGVMYGKGQGVVQDYVRAHMWFNLSYVSGDAYGATELNIIAEKMTQQQIGEAQKMAKECQARNFKNCD